MYAVIIISLFAVLFAYFNSLKDFKHGLKISFLLIFIFLAIRYNFGNDYQNYFKDFLEINRYDSINYLNNSFHYEAGWLFLCRLFKPLGFFAMVIFLSLFNCVVYYWFIHKYVPVKYYWFAVFLYTFDPAFMLTHLTAMRQSVAIAMFVLSIPYIYKKDLVRYLLCITIAFLFHSSALILIPVFLIGVFNWKINKTWAIVLFGVFVMLFVSVKFLLPAINEIIRNYFIKYEIYQGTSQQLNSGFGIFVVAVLFVFTLYYARFQNQENSVLFKLAVLSFVIVPLSLSISLISRIGMYFATATILVYALILAESKAVFVKYFFAVFLIMFTLYNFGMFFNSDIYRKGFENYHTIFSAPTF
jgi:hypothetical protein